MAMKMTLHPDPGTGHSWRLTLEVGDVEFSADIEERLGRIGRDEIIGAKARALVQAERIADALDLRRSFSDGSCVWVRP
jgi:hypothetical protein